MTPKVVSQSLPNLYSAISLLIPILKFWNLGLKRKNLSKRRSSRDFGPLTRESPLISFFGELSVEFVSRVSFVGSSRLYIDIETFSYVHSVI